MLTFPRTVIWSSTVLALLSISDLASGQGNCAIGASYCPATPNSTGQPGVLTVIGSADGGPGHAITLHASQIPPMTGVFIHGSAATQVPFGNGFRCVGSIIRTMPVVPVAGQAEITLATDPFAFGTTRYFQYWHRDPQANPGLQNFSDAVAVTFDGSGCEHVGVNSLSTTQMGEAQVVTASGAGFGSLSKDLSVAIVDGLETTFARSLSASNMGLSFEAGRPDPNMAAGNLRVRVGVGSVGSTLSNLSPDMTLDEDVWAWTAVGADPSTTSNIPLSLVQSPPDGGLHLRARVQNGLLRVTLPAGTTTPAGARVRVQIYGTYKTGSGALARATCEAVVAYHSNQVLNTCEVAEEISTAIGATFSEYKNLVVNCSVSHGDCNLDEVTVTIKPPLGGTWESAGIYIRVL